MILCYKPTGVILKKILFVIQSLRIGGAERMQVTLANKLVNSGYDVTIVTWKPMIDLKCDLDERVHFIYRAPNQHLGAKIPYIATNSTTTACGSFARRQGSSTNTT